MNYPTLYASARNGWAITDPDQPHSGDLSPLFEAIISRSTTFIIFFLNV